MRLHLPLYALALLAAAAAPTPSPAQGLNFSGGNNGGQPIEILANEGIEWHREAQRYIARGNASARQGETTVYGDMLTAYYRTQPAGGTEIFRYEAQGRVRIATPTQNAVGDKGVYDIDTGVLVLTGNNLKFTTPSETITAKDSLEFWETRRVAVARGNAIAITQDRRMTGDVLTAHFVEGRQTPAPQARNNARQAPQPAARNATNARAQPAPAAARGTDNGTRLQRVEGFGNVHVSTATDIVRGDRGVYNADTSIAMMSGNVRITRGQNQLNGDFAEVNLNTGISRLLTRADGNTGGDGRVRGVFVPEKQDQRTGQPAGSSPLPGAQ